MESHSNTSRRGLFLLAFSLLFSLFVAFSAVGGEMPRLWWVMIASDVIVLLLVGYRFWLGDRGSTLRKDCIAASLLIIVTSSILSILSVYVFHG